MSMKIWLDFDDEGEKLVARLEAQTGVRNHRELFNNALTLLDWAVQQRLQGRIIASLDEESKNYKEVLMPVLEYAASLAVQPAKARSA